MLNEDGISTMMHPLALEQSERSGLRYVVGDFNNWYITVYVQTPRKRHRRRGSHIIIVGENEFEIRLLMKTISAIDGGFLYELEFRVWIGKRELQAIELRGLPAGPRYCELLG